MTYDEKLAERIRRVIPPTGDIVEKKMFGGLALLVDGKMFIGITDKDLMVRVGADAYAAALARPHVRPMDFTGRPLTGYVYVSAAGSRTDEAVADWARRAIGFVRTLATKPKPKRARPRPRRKHTSKPRVSRTGRRTYRRTRARGASRGPRHPQQ